MGNEAGVLLANWPLELGVLESGELLRGQGKSTGPPKSQRIQEAPVAFPAPNSVGSLQGRPF